MKHDTNQFVDHFVFTKKSPFMQRVGDLVRSGHTSYVQGRVSLEKAGFLAGKFESRFSICRDNLEASRARRAGLSTSRLILLEQKTDEDLNWILLHRHGTELDHSEKWRDALKDRVNITGYELVRITKPEEPKPVWTWRYSRKRHDEIREEFIMLIRQQRDADLERMIETIWRTPGFAGARDQVKKFKDLILSEWRRSRRAGQQVPIFPERMAYLRRIPDVGAKLSAVRKRRLAADRARTEANPEPSTPVLQGRHEENLGSLWFEFLGGTTPVGDVRPETLSLLQGIVEARMREADRQLGAADARRWLESFLDWPQPRFMCSRPADVVACQEGIAEVIAGLVSLPADCFA
jgi:hypothetical protein